MDFLTLAKERYSVRRLTDRPVEQEKIDKIIEAAIAAPTACNNQPFKIWVLQSPEALEKVCQTTPFKFVKEAPMVFVVGGDAGAAWKRRFDDHNFVDVDVSIVATHMMLEVQDLGLGTTWVGHFDPNRMRELFPEMKDYELVCVFGVGYPAADATPADGHAASRGRDELVSVL